MLPHSATHVHATLAIYLRSCDANPYMCVGHAIVILRRMLVSALDMGVTFSPVNRVTHTDLAACTMQQSTWVTC